MSEQWKEPEGGPYQVAITAKLYEARTAEVEGFFGRPLSKYNSNLVHEHVSYTVFRFATQDDADRFMQAFEGKPFDPRDKGRDQKWMFWYKGRAAKRDANRSPYDFSAE